MVVVTEHLYSGLEIQVYVSSIDLNLQPFKGNGDVSKCGTKNPNININNQPTVYMFFSANLEEGSDSEDWRYVKYVVP